MTSLASYMKYSFRESKLVPDFAPEKLAEIKELIDRSITFTIACMPGIGASVFMRYLASQDFAYFIYIDIYSLTNLSKKDLYILLLKELGGIKIPKEEQSILQECRERLKDLVAQNERVVLIFNRFDQLNKSFDNQLFADLISLRNTNNEKIVIILTGNKPYSQILPDNITGDKFNLVSKTFYLTPYSKSDLQKLLKIAAVHSGHTKAFLDKAVDLSGGHFQLLQLFLKAERLEAPFIDRYIKFQLKELYDYLSYHQRKQVQQIAFGKIVDEVDHYLIEIGMVKKIDERYQLFTPLFADYIRSNSQVKLPVKERTLFNFLKKRLDSVVSKEEIFNEVWGENNQEASDWALNALIYRLKKNPGFTSSGYVIESHKKIGYSLAKI